MWYSDTPGCTGINLYFQRTPSVTPDADCANPASTTSIKCALYASTITLTGGSVAYEEAIGPEDAVGEAFMSVVAGSNAYNYNC